MTQIETNTPRVAHWPNVPLSTIVWTLHRAAMKPFLEMRLAGACDGIDVADEIMLVGGTLVDVPATLMLFCLLLAFRTEHPLTAFAAFTRTTTLVPSTMNDLGDLIDLVTELAGRDGLSPGRMDAARTRLRCGSGRQRAYAG